MNRSSIFGIVAGLAAASIWGGMYVVSKVVLEVIPPFSLLTIRLVLGALTLGLAIALRPKPEYTQRVSSQKDGGCGVLRAGYARPQHPTPRFIGMIPQRQFLNSFLVGVVGYGVSLSFQFVGTKLSTASNGALVTSATPAFVLLFAPFLLGERNTPRRILALAISTIGVVAVIDPRNAELSPSLFWGNMCLLAAGLTWALYSVLVRKVSKNNDLLITSTIMLIGGLPVSIPAGAWELSTRGTGTLTLGTIGGILYLGIISTAIAMFLWNYAFAKLPAAAASLTFFAQPVVGTLLGWLILGEIISPLFLIGGVLVGIGIVISGIS